MCFHGKPYCCWIDIDRYHGHKRKVYDMNWRAFPWVVGNFETLDKDIPKPRNYELMVQLVEKLCAGFEHVRVDMYNISGRIFFGEMTFTSGAGTEGFRPDELDFTFGDMWDLTVPQINENVFSL